MNKSSFFTGNSFHAFLEVNYQTLDQNYIQWSNGDLMKKNSVKNQPLSHNCYSRFFFCLSHRKIFILMSALQVYYI